MAQWLGARLEQLKQRGSYQDLYVQLDYMLYELNGNESQANTQLLRQDTIDGATTAFQNGFERCNPYYCMQNQRIQYAWDVYNRNNQ